MTISIETIWHELSVHVERGIWRLRSLNPIDLMLGPVGMRIQWHEQGESRAWNGRFAGESVDVDKHTAGPLGTAKSAVLDAPTGSGALGIKIAFLLCEECPLFLWRAVLTNRSSEAIFLDRLTLFQTVESDPAAAKRREGSKPLEWSLRSYEELHAPEVEDPRWAFYSSGWQSWTFAGTLTPRQWMPRTHLGPLTKPVQIQHGTEIPRRKGFFGSDMFGVIGTRRGRRGLLAGFLSQQQGFGSLDVRFSRFGVAIRLWMAADGVRVDPGGAFVSDWSCLQFLDLDEPQPLGLYLDSVAMLHGKRRVTDTSAGWCSWYQHYQDVTEADVIRSLHWAQENIGAAPLDIIQIDDGYQAEIGDWLERDRTSFPQAMGQLSSEIEQAGFKSGIWLAPFLARPAAEILAEHSDWLLRTPSGRPAAAGFIWDAFPRALDVTHPGVREHLQRVIRTLVHDWGYRYLKLDFLYAGALPGARYDRTKTRAQALRSALELIREAAGERVTLAACGCPLGSAVGIVDSMRIGPDVATHWLPEYRRLGFMLKGEPGLPSLRNALRTSLARAHLHGRWWINDVDCMLLRDTDTSLTPSEVQTLATVVSLSGGTMMVSDDLERLSRERAAWLKRLLPVLPEAARVVDWFDSQPPSVLLLPLRGSIGAWWLVAVINWQDDEADLNVPLRRLGLDENTRYHGVDFWREAYIPSFQGFLNLKAVPPHGVRFMGIRKHQAGAQWVGDSLHTSQGLGIQTWKQSSQSLRTTVDYGRSLHGRAWLTLPSNPTQLRLGETSGSWDRVAEDLYAVDLDSPRGVDIVVRWE